MDFVLTRVEDLGARPEDVAQEAVDATATTYTNDASIDVTEHLRAQLSSRGLRAAREDELEGLAAKIRSGYHVRLGEHDGSIDASPPTPEA